MLTLEKARPATGKGLLAAAIGGLPAPFWVLWAGMLVNRIGSFVLPLLSLYLAQERGFTDEQVGFTVALYGLGSVLGNQVGGALADRIGRRATLLFGLGSGALAMLGLGFAEEPAAIAAGTAGLGLFGESYRPAMQAMVADLVPPADRARAFGLTYWANNLGFAASAALAGVLAKVSYLLLFVGDAATTLGYGLVVLFLVAETRPATAARRPVAALLLPFRDGAFMAFWLLTVITASVFMQHVVPLALAMKGDGLTAAEYGRVLAVNGLLIVLVQPWAGPILARWPRGRVLALGTVVIGLGFGATAFAQTLPAYALTVVVWTLGEIAVLPTCSAVVADLAPPDLRGTYQGTQNVAWGLSWVVGPIVGTQVLARIGPGLWVGCLAVALAVAAGHRAWARSRRID